MPPAKDEVEIGFECHCGAALRCFGAERRDEESGARCEATIRAELRLNEVRIDLENFISIARLSRS